MEETLNILNKKAKQVLGFFIAKELLWTNQKIKPYHGKIDIKDAIWVAEHIEPRVLEVLPAAMIHFPKVFLGNKDIPQELNEILLNIRKGAAPPMLMWKGIETKKMLKWANMTLKDKRTRPISQKKVNRTFSLSPQTSAKLKKLSTQNQTTETGILEKLIESAS